MVRIRQLVLLLSSNHDGECVAAARALGKTLIRNGHDWHWLADRVDRLLSGSQTAASQLEIDEHQAAAIWLLDNCRTRLRENELDFLQTMSSWLGEPTYRQAAWLNRLCQRHGYRQ